MNRVATLRGVSSGTIHQNQGYGPPLNTTRRWRPRWWRQEPNSHSAPSGRSPIGHAGSARGT